MPRLMPTITVALLFTASAMADQRTGGDNAYFIDHRAPITSTSTFVWPEAAFRGGDGYNGPARVSAPVKITIIHKKPRGGDNK